jgi:serine/threonine protein kinase
MPLSVGERLGPYEILAPTGAGGMGEVWKARDTRLDRIVAKVVKEKFSERFEREARVVAALNHPHICTLHDVGPNYLVMEYVEGTPAPFGELVVTGRRQMATGADCGRTLARSYSHFDALFVGAEVGVVVHKTPEAITAV